MEKLYLNYGKDIQPQWSAIIPENISNANLEWPQLLDKAKNS